MKANADEPLSRAEVESCVHAVDPDLSVENVAGIDQGHDELHLVTVAAADGRRDLVLKVCEASEPERFRTEPCLLAFVGANTSVPVPELVGAVDEHPELPAPLFLMEHCPGEHVAGHELHRDALGRVAREAGRHLAEIHALATFEGCGVLLRRRDDPSVDAGVVTDDCALGVAGDDSWRDWLVGQIHELSEGAEARFADLAVDVRGHLDSEADLLETDGPAVLTHADYFYENLLVDPETGETWAVLDHGKMLATPAEFNLVQTEQFLCGFAPLDSERRQRVREELYAGCGETNGLDRGRGFERRRDYYLATTWLGPLALFSDYYAGKYGVDPDEQARRYRTALSTLTS